MSAPLFSAAEQAMEDAKWAARDVLLARDPLAIFEAAWLACREWAEERHREEIAALNEEHEDLLTKAEDICWERAEERERVLLEALEGVVEWLQIPDYCRHSDLVAARQALETARAALASSTPQEKVRMFGAQCEYSDEEELLPPTPQETPQ